VEPFWRIFVKFARENGGRVSEYELYFNFIRTCYRAVGEPSLTTIRPLSFAICSDWASFISDPPPGVSYLVSHDHLRRRSRESLFLSEGIIGGPRPGADIDCPLMQPGTSQSRDKTSVDNYTSVRSRFRLWLSRKLLEATDSRSIRNTALALARNSSFLEYGEVA